MAGEVSGLGRGVRWSLAAAALGALAVGCKPKAESAAPSARQGLVFCAHQSQTVRGTGPYVVDCGETPKKDCLLTVTRCGGRVVGLLPPNALLVETSVFALAKMSTNGCFAAVRELLPQDKVAAGFVAGEATVTALTQTDRDALAAFVREKGAAILGGAGGRTAFRAKLTAELVKELAAKGEVRRIAP